MNLKLGYKLSPFYLSVLRENVCYYGAMVTFVGFMSYMYEFFIQASPVTIGGLQAELEIKRTTSRGQLQITTNKLVINFFSLLFVLLKSLCLDHNFFT